MNSSGLAVSRALYDLLLLLLGWCCMEAAATGVCVLVHCSGACHVLAGFSFLYWFFNGESLVFPGRSQTSPARAFYVGWQPCDTYRN